MATNEIAPPPVAPPLKLRIGLFSESFHPVQNGVTTSLLTLIHGLRTQKHHVWVFAPAHQQQPEEERNVYRFPSFVTHYNPEYPVAVPFLPRLALTTRLPRLRLNIVHTHTPFVLGLTGANLAVRRDIPLVSTYHTLYSEYSHYVPLLPEALKQSMLDHYLPWYYNRCAEIICPSQIAADSLMRQGIERPITVIPTGIPLPPPEAVSETARCVVRETLGLAPDTPLLLYAGRLAKEKNVGWLLEVFVRVRAKVPAARLALAGSGAQDELREQADALGLRDAVLFLGPWPRQEFDALYAAGDVFCFPSPSETQGLVIGEARAAGTPAVVVDAGGAPETVTNGADGFRVPVGDGEAFAARVVALLTDANLRHRMRACALRNAQQATPGSDDRARCWRVSARAIGIASARNPHAPRTAGMG